MAPGWRIAALFLFCWLSPVVAAAPLKVAVLDDAPPLGYRDAAGKLTGFSVVLMQALCAEMAESCEFEAVKLEHLVDDLAAGHFDVAAVGLIATPERRRKLVFTKPVYRSQTLFFARPGIRPEMRKVRISTFKGSAQESYIRTQGWDLIGARTAEQMVEQLQAGVAQACVVPMMTGLNLQKNSQFLRLGLNYEVLQAAELESNAAFAITPQQARLKPALDKALENIKRNGVFDRINSLYLPLRID
jgi:ABC-type amino acid transport substrate-binding protein